MRVPYTELIETCSKEFFSKPRLSKRGKGIDTLESIVKSDHEDKMKTEKMKVEIKKNERSNKKEGGGISVMAPK